MAEIMMEPNNGIYLLDLSESDLASLWEEFREYRPERYGLMRLPYDKQSEEDWEWFHHELLEFCRAKTPSQAHTSIAYSNMKSDMYLFWTRYLSAHKTRGQFDA
jgi:hypothetical protein